MLMKFIDEIFGIIGVLIGFLLLVIGVGAAYYYYPMTTCVIGGLGSSLGSLMCLIFLTLKPKN